jgi:outer membrane protein assembly factor BamA
MPPWIAALALTLALVLPQAAPKWTVGAIVVAGGHRYSSVDLAQLTGLTSGGPLDEPQLRDTVGKLTRSGLFTSIGYHFTQHDLTLDVTFDIEEPTWEARVLFDNFVMIPDEELVAAVRRRVPTFDGTAPVMPGIPDFFKDVLTAILAERGIGGTVDYRAGIPSPRFTAASVTYIFRLNAPGLQMCAARVDGTSPAFRKAIGADVNGLVGKDFSRYTLEQTIRQVIVTTYQPKGYWAASVGPPTLATGSAASCFGIAVSLTVNEGDAYVWDRAVWQGNTVLATAVLDRTLGMSAGDLADRSKVEDGLRRVGELYRERGYLAETHTATANLDTKTHRATVTMAIDEGVPYTMGTLNVAGTTEATAEKVRSRWRLKSGDLFDAGYLNRFAASDLPFLALSEHRKAKVDFQPDDSRHVVNVTITFK